MFSKKPTILNRLGQLNILIHNRLYKSFKRAFFLNIFHLILNDFGPSVNYYLLFNSTKRVGEH